MPKQPPARTGPARKCKIPAVIKKVRIKKWWDCGICPAGFGRLYGNLGYHIGDRHPDKESVEFHREDGRRMMVRKLTRGSKLGQARGKKRERAPPLKEKEDGFNYKAAWKDGKRTIRLLKAQL